MVEVPSPFGTIEQTWDDSPEYAKWRRARVQMETRFVARRMADKTLIGRDMIIYQCLEDKEMWISQKLYHLWMFLVFFNSDNEEDGFWKKMKDLGEKLVKEDEEKGKLAEVENVLD